MGERFRLVLFLSIMALLIFYGVSFGLNMPDDAVLSQHIKDADNTTGQDTNLGSGVKTGHIQNGAVTTEKIGENSITSTKLQPNSVTADKIVPGAVTSDKLGLSSVSAEKLQPGSVLSDKIAPGAISADKLQADSVSSNALQPGSVTSDKITPQGITSEKIAPGAITSDKIETGAILSNAVSSGSITPDKLSFYRNVIVVATAGGDFTSPVDAMNAIVDASASNPYLVKIMPGVYDIGANTVQMKPFVDIEGSGENVTIIQGNPDSQTAGVINGASDAELRFLKVKNYGTGTWSIGIYNNNAALLLNHMFVEVTGGLNAVGMYNVSIPTDSLDMRMHSIELIVTGGTTCYGIYNDRAWYILADSSIISKCTGVAVNYGAYNINSPTQFKRTSLLGMRGGTNYGFYNAGGAPPRIEEGITTGDVLSASGTVYIAGTRLNTPVGPPGAGTLKCVGTYNGFFDPVGPNCL